MADKDQTCPRCEGLLLWDGELRDLKCTACSRHFKPSAVFAAGAEPISARGRQRIWNWERDLSSLAFKDEPEIRRVNVPGCGVAPVRQDLFCKASV